MTSSEGTLVTSLDYVMMVIQYWQRHNATLEKGNCSQSKEQLPGGGKTTMS